MPASRQADSTYAAHPSPQGDNSPRRFAGSACNSGAIPGPAVLLGVLLDTAGRKDAVLGAATEATVPVAVRSERTACEAVVPERRMQAGAVVGPFAARRGAVCLPSSSNPSRCVLGGWRTSCRSLR